MTTSRYGLPLPVSGTIPTVRPPASFAPPAGCLHHTPHPAAYERCAHPRNEPAEREGG
jgi:hypothetical protein